MDKVKVCRICLIKDVKMYDLHSYPLYEYFQAITGINPLSTIDLPPYGCFECAALLKKYYLFRQKCLVGQTELYNILENVGEITLQGIDQINRKASNLTSKLEIYTTENVVQLLQEENSTIDIKSEDLPDNVPQNYLVEVPCIKVEEFGDELPSPLASSDDDEPLSLHKSQKEKKKKSDKKKVKKERKKKEFKLEEVDLEFNDQLKVFEETNELPPLEAEPAKRKRGRPRLTEKRAESESKGKPRRTPNTGGVDADQMDLEEYVTIVKLTREEQKEEIEKRKSSSNYVNAPFKCDICYKGFIDTMAWNHHVAKHDPSAGEAECGVCKFRFKTKRALQKHASNHEKKYACKACSYVSKTTTQAKQHQRWHNGVTYKCQYCDEVSTKWTSYLSHVRIKHPSQFICGVCGYSYVSKLGLAMHKTMMHKDVVEKTEPEGSPAGPYCAECDVQFASAEAWRRHMVTSANHAQANDFNNGCRVCGSAFESAEQLRLHHRREHARKRPRNYGKKTHAAAWPAACEHCSEVIPNAREYWTHFRRAHPDKNYPIQKNYICDICGKGFRGNAFLVYHKRTHSSERAYKCAQCPKAFFNRTNLQMHEKTHSDIRPYPCSVCFKAFKGKGALDRHFRSHTGVKPYECEVCGKAFGQSNSRKLHVRTVHLKQPAPYVSRARLGRKAERLPFGFRPPASE